MSEKPARIIPPLTDAELDSRAGGPGEFSVNRKGVVTRESPVTPDTIKRVDEALRWHEKRAKKRSSP